MRVSAVRQFVLALSLSFCALGRADLVLHDKPRHETDFKQAYAGFPTRGKSLAAHVWELKPWPWVAATGIDDPNIIGLYSIDGTIHLRELPAKDARLVFSHEYGHFLYFKVFSDGERADWESFWQSNRAVMPREYARVNPAEGWAEAFAVTYAKTALPTAWGYPKGYRESPILLAKVRSYFGAAHV